MAVRIDQRAPVVGGIGGISGGTSGAGPQPFDPTPVEPVVDERVDQLLGTVSSLYDTVLALSEQQNTMSTQVQQIASANPFADVVGDPEAESNV